MKKILAITLGLSLGAVVARAADVETKPAPPATPPAPAGRVDLLKKYDKNGDGKLDEEERAAMRKDREAEILKRYDKNGDGKLDESERQAMREEMQKQRQAALARRQAEQKKKEETKPDNTPAKK